MVTTGPKLRKALQGRAPSLEFERAAWSAGAQVVVGLDEVGRGAWAGPLTVGAVAVPPDRRITKVRDSKQLTPAERVALVPRIETWALSWGIGHAWPEECDELGMAAAQRLAAHRALEALGVVPDHLLVDGPHDFVGGYPFDAIVKGDQRSLGIAAASVLAKVARDALMRAEAEHFPAYAFDASKGYPCPRHRMALVAYGPTSIHRRSWSFMDDLPWSGQPRVRRPEPQLSLFE